MYEHMQMREHTHTQTLKILVRSEIKKEYIILLNEKVFYLFISFI